MAEAASAPTEAAPAPAEPQFIEVWRPGGRSDEWRGPRRHGPPPQRAQRQSPPTAAAGEPARESGKRAAASAPAPSPAEVMGERLLKLVALDNDDIEVLSAHVQDSVVKVGDIMWRPTERRVIVVLNRFDWESAQNL